MSGVVVCRTAGIVREAPLPNRNGRRFSGNLGYNFPSSPGFPLALGNGVATLSNSKDVASFGGFQLDLRSGELRRDDFVVKLQPQPAKVLVLLVSRAGEIVTRALGAFLSALRRHG